MSRTDTAPDSSMEEILASIRRIISEDASTGSAPLEVARKATVPPAVTFRSGEMAQPLNRPIAGHTAPMPAPVQNIAPDDDDILDLDANYAAVTRRLPPLPEVPAPQLSATSPQMQENTASGTTAAAIVFVDDLLQSESDSEEDAAVEGIVVSETSVTGTDEPRSDAAFESEQNGRVEHVLELASAEPFTTGPSRSVPQSAMAVAPPVHVIAAEPPPSVAVPEALKSIVPASVDEIAPTENDVELDLPLAARPPQPSAPDEVASASAQTAPQAVASQRTMEETVAEMLRPMLREWLDANMPRILEKTLNKSGG